MPDGLSLSLRGMQGYEQLSIGVDKVTSINQTKTEMKTNEDTHEAKIDNNQ